MTRKSTKTIETKEEREIRADKAFESEVQEFEKALEKLKSLTAKAVKDRAAFKQKSGTAGWFGVSDLTARQTLRLPSDAQVRSKTGCTRESRK